MWLGSFWDGHQFSVDEMENCRSQIIVIPNNLQVACIQGKCELLTDD